jgi:hypothetical protein
MQSLAEERGPEAAAENGNVVGSGVDVALPCTARSDVGTRRESGTGE